MSPNYRLIPALVLLGALVLWHPGREESSGFLLGGLGGNANNAEFLDRRSAFLEFDRGQLGVQAELPDPIGAESHLPSIIVRKPSNGVAPFEQTRTRWHYLSANLRHQIRTVIATESNHRWRRLAVHASGSTTGNAALLNAYHAQRDTRLSNGAYHMVIGNGSFSGNGEITLGSRWHEQLPSATMKIDEVNAASLSVCLIGDFTETGPNRAQWRALDELTAYLRAQLGSLEVVTHRQLESTAPACPGPGFSSEVLNQLSKRTRR